MTFCGKWPSVEDDLRWKKDFWWKTTIGGRWPLVEDYLGWKTTLGGRRPPVEDNLWWKTTFSGKKSLVENDLWWKTSFNGRCMLPTLRCGFFFNKSISTFWGDFLSFLRGWGLRFHIQNLEGMLPLLVIFYTFLWFMVTFVLQKLLKETIKIFKHFPNKWTILSVDLFH